jgi:hypothetical protein
MELKGHHSTLILYTADIQFFDISVGDGHAARQ